MKKIISIIFIINIFFCSAKAVENNYKEIKYAPPFDKYMPKIHAKITKNWNYSVVKKSYNVLVIFAIDKKGNLLACKIAKSSNYPLADEEVLNAIKRSAPFPPLPKEFSGNMIKISYTFNHDFIEQEAKNQATQKKKRQQKRTFEYNPNFSYARINAIGKRLIRYNGLDPNVKFELSDEDIVNAYADSNKTIMIFKGLLEAIDGEDDTEELASVIAHELGHIENAHLKKHIPFLVFSAITQIAGSVVDTLFTEEALKNVNDTMITATGDPNSKISAENTIAIVNTSIFNKISRKDEYEADLTGVDIMVNAGYNPLAMIVMLYKISSEDYIEFFYDHPTGIKRIMNCYDYIKYNYPDYIKYGYDSPTYEDALILINEELKFRTEKDIRRIEKKQIEFAKKRELRGLKKLWTTKIL